MHTKLTKSVFVARFDISKGDPRLRLGLADWESVAEISGHLLLLVPHLQQLLRGRAQNTSWCSNNLLLLELGGHVLAGHENGGDAEQIKSPHVESGRELELV